MNFRTERLELAISAAREQGGSRRQPHSSIRVPSQCGAERPKPLATGPGPLVTGHIETRPMIRKKKKREKAAEPAIPTVLRRERGSAEVTQFPRAALKRSSIKGVRTPRSARNRKIDAENAPLDPENGAMPHAATPRMHGETGRTEAATTALHLTRTQPAQVKTQAAPADLTRAADDAPDAALTEDVLMSPEALAPASFDPAIPAEAATGAPEAAGAARSPLMAGLLSLLLCGLGQIYNREWAKGVMMMMLSLVLWTLLLGWLINIWSAGQAVVRASRARAEALGAAGGAHGIAAA